MNDIDIFVAMHQRVEIPTIDKAYKFVQAGTENSIPIEGIEHDNSGSNISNKNSSFCELTVLYWGWKNSKADIKGLCHYRRFFSKVHISENKKYFLTSKDIRDNLKNADIIVPEPTFYDYRTVQEGYVLGDYGLAEDLCVLEKSIQMVSPEYCDAYHEIMNSYKMSFFNMMIAPKAIYDQYCEWLFSVLFDVEKNIDISKREGNQIRVFGYMSERLLNVWLLYNKLKVKYYPVIKLGENKNILYKGKCCMDALGVYVPLKNLKDMLIMKKKYGDLS